MKFFLNLTLCIFICSSILSQVNNNSKPSRNSSFQTTGIVSASFTAPDTVCVNSTVNITNTSIGATNYYWSFCEGNFSSTPDAVNLGDVGGQFSLPVFTDIAQDNNGNYYVFTVNNFPGQLVRMNFGNSLLNTPLVDNLGNLGGAIPNNAEGIQVQNVNGDWIAIIVGGDPASGVTPNIVKVDFGASLSSTTPVATNWGNIGNMSYPVDLYVFNENSNWYGYTVNAKGNSITFFNFGSNFSSAPVGTNLGNLGNLNFPVGIGVISNNGNWYMFVINQLDNSITRLNFGSSLLNTPVATNLGAIGTLDNPRDISFIQLCKGIEGLVVNATSNSVSQLDFGNDLTSTPIATSLGNLGNLDFPHSISKLFRVNNDIYAFVPNVNTNSITRLHFAGCSTPGSTLQNPAPVTYSQPGTYNINLLVDVGLATQTSFCKQIVVKNCTTGLCNGSLGDPVVNITFGSGNNPGPALPTAAPGASTTLTYVAVTGNPATPTPVDGQYTITNNVPVNGDWFSGAFDHTSNNGTGYMAFYNASEQPGEFYNQTVNNLCGSTTYEFAAWIANALDPSKVIGVNPDITFRIEQTDGTLLGSFDTGPIAQNSTFTWQQFGFYFTTPLNVSTVVLKMINNNPGGVANFGNDLAIDDITFRPCGPLITGSFNAASIVDSISVCQNSNVILYGHASNGYTNPGYLWQYSSDSGKTWTDIPNSNSLQISVSAPSTTSIKNYKYRMLSGEGNNITALNCRISSNLTILNVTPGPQGKLSAQNICPGNNASLIFTSASVPSPFSIVWTDGTNNYSQSNLNNNSAFATPFNLSATSVFKLHSVTDGNGCTNILDSGFTITVNPLPKGYLTGGDICDGDDAVLLFTATSGSPIFNIAYSSNGNAYAYNGIANNTTFTVPFHVTDTSVFRLTSIVDGNGCSSTLDTTATINVIPLPQGGLTGNTACSGDSAGIIFNASSGTGPFEVEISDGTNATTYYDVKSGIPFRITPLTQTTTISLISIIDKDGNGCSRTSGFTSPDATITVQPSPHIQFDSLTAICIQQSTFLITQAKETTGIAGTGSFSGNGVDATGNFSPASAGVGTHTIKYTYTAANGCMASDSSYITVNPLPVVSAGQDIITCLGFSVQLNATGASTYIWSPVTGLDNPSAKSPVATPDSTTTYVVLGTDSNGCYASDTVAINVSKSGIAVFVVPNAFTPNGDGVNDCFGIRRWGDVTVVEFSIFNRWGQLVFSTKNPSDCWDGTFQGKPQASAGYPYIIKAKTPCGDVARRGVVMLVR